MSLRQEFGGEAVRSKLGHDWEVGLARVTIAIGPESGANTIPGFGIKAHPTANTSFNNDGFTPI